MLLSIRPILRILPLILAFLTTLAPAALRAQIDVRAGANVRVLAPSVADSLLRGRLMAIDSASLLPAPTSAGSLNVPMARVEWPEVFRPGPRKTLTGALVGTLLGAAAGYGIAHAALVNTSCDYICGAAEAGSAILGGTVGLVTGGMVGSRSRGEGRWVEVPVDSRSARP